MNLLAKTALAGAIAFGVLTTSVYADSATGQKYYLKFLKPKTGYNGTKFAAMHTQAEWKALFADDAAGFKKEFTGKHPELKEFLEGDTFKKIVKDLQDFAVEYANDSGNVPSC